MNNIFPQLFDLIIIYIGKVKYLKTIYPFDDLIKQNQKLQTGHSNYSNFCQGIVALAVLDHLTMAFFTIGIEWRKCQCCNQPFKFKLILEKVFILSLCLENLSEFLILFFPATILEAYYNHIKNTKNHSLIIFVSRIPHQIYLCTKKVSVPQICLEHNRSVGNSSLLLWFCVRRHERHIGSWKGWQSSPPCTSYENIKSFQGIYIQN